MTNSSSIPIDDLSALVRTDPSRALSTCNDLLRSDPENGLLLLHKFHACARLKDWSTALVAADQMIAAEPDEDMGHFLAAQANYNLEAYADAIKNAKEAIAHDKEKTLSNIPYFQIAFSYAYLGNEDAAQSYVDKAHAIEPEDWYPPIYSLPAGTITQYKNLLTRIAKSVSDQVK